jgi:hypothetical protein
MNWQTHMPGGVSGRKAEPGDPTDGAEEEQVAAAHLLDHVQPREGREDVDAVGDDLDDERVLEVRVLEVLRAVVEDEVDAGQLLQRLEQASRQEALSDGALEALLVARLADALLDVEVGLDLAELLEEGRVIGGQAPELAQRYRGLVRMALLDQEARGFGQENQTGLLARVRIGAELLTRLRESLTMRTEWQPGFCTSRYRCDSWCHCSRSQQ